MKEETKPALTLTLDEEQLKGAMRDAIVKGVSDGVGSWEIQNQIKNAAESALRDASLALKVGEALQELLDASAKDLAKEIASSLVAAIEAGTKSMGEVVGARLLFGLRHSVPSYDNAQTKEIHDCLKEIRAAGEES